MSVQNEITRISGKVTEQAALIEEIWSILEGKAAAVPVLQEKTVRASEEIKTVVPDTGYDGLSKVTVEALKLQGLAITPQGGKGDMEYTYSLGEYDGLGVVNILADDDLIPENVKEGVEIYGITGSLKAELDGWTTGKTTLGRNSASESAIYYPINISGVTSEPSIIYVKIGDIQCIYLTDLNIRIGNTPGVSISTATITGSSCSIKIEKTEFSMGTLEYGMEVVYGLNNINGYGSGVPHRVNSITATGSYTSATYQQGYWAAITQDGHLIITVKGGTSTSYESIYFTNASLPTRVGLLGQSYYSYSSMTAGQMYVAIYEGISKDVNITLNFNATNSSSDYVQCAVTIAYV